MKVSELLEKPESWCQNACVTDAEGNPVVYAGDPNAARWCVAWAVAKCYQADRKAHWAALDRLADIIEVRTGNRSIMAWNDTPGRTHEEVLALVKEAQV